MKRLWDGGTKVCSNDPCHMTKAAAMPIYGKSLKNLLLWNHRVLEYYRVCSNDDHGLTLTYFTARSSLVPYTFLWEKGKTMIFLETIVVFDVEIGTCS